MGDGFKGILAGLFSGIVWAIIAATGVAVIASVYHDQLVADIQPRIPPPQPILPDFPQLGYTTPPTADHLIQTAVGMAVSWVFFLGVVVGPILGLVFASLEKSFPRTMNVILKGIIFAVVADLLYALVVFPQQSNPLGVEVQAYGYAFSFVAAAIAGLVLGFLYRRLGGGVIVQHQLTDYEAGQRIQPS